MLEIRRDEALAGKQTHLEPNVANRHSLVLLPFMRAAPSEPPERSIQEYKR